MDLLFGTIGGLLFSALWWAVLLPAGLVGATPYILIRSIPGEGRYLRKVRGRYGRLFEFWKEYGWAFPP